MKYSLQEVTAHCQTRPDLWHQITQNFHPSPDFQTIETPFEIPDLSTLTTEPSTTQWPLWARAIAKYRRPTDLGLGDTIVHLIGDARSARFKKWFENKFGQSCGCTARQHWLNTRFPYHSDGPQSA